MAGRLSAGAGWLKVQAGLRGAAAWMGSFTWRGQVLACSASLVLLSGCLSHSLTSIQVTPASVTLSVGQTSQLSAQGTLTENNHASTSIGMTSQVAWSSSNVAVATVNTAGLVSGVSAGTATITATVQGSFGELVATSAVTVNAASSTASSGLTGMTITPTTATITNTGETAQYIAIGSYSGGQASANLTGQVTWTSSNTSVAIIDSLGVATGVGAGTATITASIEGTSGLIVSNASVTVTNSPRTLTSLTIIPTTQTVDNVGETAQFIAIGAYSSGSPATADLTSHVLWTSSDTTVATINSTGLATANGRGTAAITAQATASDGSVVTNTAALTNNGAVGTSGLPTLTLYEVGSGAGTVTGVANGVTVLDCTVSGGTAQGCVASFPLNGSVTLTAQAGTGSKFDGWSLPCEPQPDTTATCTITMSGNYSVGAIFDATVHSQARPRR